MNRRMVPLVIGILFTLVSCKQEFKITGKVNFNKLTRVVQQKVDGEWVDSGGTINVDKEIQITEKNGIRNLTISDMHGNISYEEVYSEVTESLVQSPR